MYIHFNIHVWLLHVEPLKQMDFNDCFRFPCMFVLLHKFMFLPFSVLFPLLAFSCFAFWFWRFLSKSLRIKCLCPCLALRTGTSALASTPAATPAPFFSPSSCWWRSSPWWMPSGELFIFLRWLLKALNSFKKEKCYYKAVATGKGKIILPSLELTFRKARKPQHKLNFLPR